MTIKFNCSTCNTTINAPDAAAGKKGKCPTCGNVMQIPATSSAPAPSAPATPAAPLRTPDPKFPVPAAPTPVASTLPPLQPLQPLSPLPTAGPAAGSIPALQPLKPPTTPSGTLPPLSMSGLAGNQGQGQGLGADGLYSLQPTSSPGPLLNPLDSLPMGGASLPPSQPMLGGGLPNPYATPSMSPALPSSGGYSGGYNRPAAWPIIVPGSIQLFGILLTGIMMVVQISPLFFADLDGDPALEQNKAAYFVGVTIGVGIILVVMTIAAIGSICMILRKCYPLALTGSIFSCIGCASIFCIPIGIWSVTVLCISDYRNQFYRKD
ncbi:MAG: hypothetical protein ACO1RA_05145 [Planctomycetaceae bacterium]